MVCLWVLSSLFSACFNFLDIIYTKVELVSRLTRSLTSVHRENKDQQENLEPKAALACQETLELEVTLGAKEYKDKRFEDKLSVY